MTVRETKIGHSEFVTGAVAATGGIDGNLTMIRPNPMSRKQIHHRHQFRHRQNRLINYHRQNIHHRQHRLATMAIISHR